MKSEPAAIGSADRRISPRSLRVPAAISVAGRRDFVSLERIFRSRRPGPFAGMRISGRCSRTFGGRRISSEVHRPRDACHDPAASGHSRRGHGRQGSATLAREPRQATVKAPESVANGALHQLLGIDVKSNSRRIRGWAPAGRLRDRPDTRRDAFDRRVFLAYRNGRQLTFADSQGPQGGVEVKYCDAPRFGSSMATAMQISSWIDCYRLSRRADYDLGAAIRRCRCPPHCRPS